MNWGVLASAKLVHRGFGACRCESAVGDIEAQDHDGQHPGLGIGKGLDDLGGVDLIALVPGFVGLEALEGDELLFFCEEVGCIGCVGETEEHEDAPEEGNDGEDDEEPLHCLSLWVKNELET
jgi:hypothetical protein